jgi:hypothetical protein
MAKNCDCADQTERTSSTETAPSMEIKNFLENNAFIDTAENKMLSDYFAEKSTEKNIIKTSTGVEVSRDKFCGKRYVVTIKMPVRKLWPNQSRIESNLLDAIRKLVEKEKPHWNPNVISKVEIDV